MTGKTHRRLVRWVSLRVLALSVWEWLQPHWWFLLVLLAFVAVLWWPVRGSD